MESDYKKSLVPSLGAKIVSSTPPAPTLIFHKQTEVLKLQPLQQFRGFPGRKLESKYPYPKLEMCCLHIHKQVFITFRNDTWPNSRLTELEEQKQWHWRESEMLQPGPPSDWVLWASTQRKLGLTVMSDWHRTSSLKQVWGHDGNKEWGIPASCPASLEVAEKFCDFGKVHPGDFPSSKHTAMLRREDLANLVWLSHFQWEQQECPQMCVQTRLPFCPDIQANFEGWKGHFSCLGKPALLVLQVWVPWSWQIWF